MVKETSQKEQLPKLDFAKFKKDLTWKIKRNEFESVAAAGCIRNWKSFIVFTGPPEDHLNELRTRHEQECGSDHILVEATFEIGDRESLKNPNNRSDFISQYLIQGIISSGK